MSPSFLVMVVGVVPLIGSNADNALLSSSQRDAIGFLQLTGRSFVTNRNRKTMRGTVQKVLKSVVPSEPERAQIGVDEAEELYREIRIENVLTNANGEKVQLKPGAEVEVIIEAILVWRPRSYATDGGLTCRPGYAWPFEHNIENTVITVRMKSQIATRRRTTALPTVASNKLGHFRRCV